MKPVYLQVWDVTDGKSTLGVDILEGTPGEAARDCRRLVRGESSHAWCDLLRVDDEGYTFIKTFRPMSAKPDDEDTVEYV